MKKLLMFVLFSMFICQNLFADEINIAADPWCPYDCEAGSEKPGFMIEFAKHIFEKAGHKVIYKNQPWTRVLKHTGSGKINGAVGAFISDAPDHIFPKEEMGISKTPFYVKKGSAWKFEGISSLEDIAIGVIRGYSYGDKLDAYIKKNQGNNARVQISNELDNLAKKLLKGRIDAFPEDSMVAGWYFKQNKLTDKFKTAGLVAEPENVYIAFSPKLKSSHEYVKIIDKGMKQLRESGEINKILSRYGLNDWK